MYSIFRIFGFYFRDRFLFFFFHFSTIRQVVVLCWLLLRVTLSHLFAVCLTLAFHRSHLRVATTLLYSSGYMVMYSFIYYANTYYFLFLILLLYLLCTYYKRPYAVVVFFFFFVYTLYFERRKIRFYLVSVLIRFYVYGKRTNFFVKQSQYCRRTYSELNGNGNVNENEYDRNVM